VGASASALLASPVLRAFVVGHDGSAMNEPMFDGN